VADDACAEVTVLTTERLTLRPLERGDVESLHEGYTDPTAMEWWHQPISGSLDETAGRIDHLRANAAQFAICLGPSSPAVGHVGWITARPGLRGGFGYFLRREHWGRGIAAEAAEAALHHGMEELGAAGAELWVYEGNRRSAALAERLGCTLRGRFVAFNAVRGRAFDTRVYGITASELGVEGAAPDPPRVVDVVPVLEVADVGASVRFWTERLGFEVEFAVGDPPTLVSVGRGDWTPARASVRFRAAPGAPPRPLAGVLDVLAPDVDQLHAELVGRRTPIAVDIATQPWGLREFTVEDPNGVRVRFYAPAL
jgi:RimJ/RimL family protein N-acetyltransferase/catechol 2,3-dioxygenase-like lactoylglutathione lyase family enzyme